MPLLAAVLVSQALAAPPTLDVAIQHDGFSRHYAVTSGQVLEDVWHDMGGTLSPPWNRRPRHDLLIRIEATPAADAPGLLDLDVAITEKKGRKEEVISHPILRFAETDPYAEFIAEGQIPNGTTAPSEAAYLSFVPLQILVKPATAQVSAMVEPAPVVVPNDGA